MYRLHTIFQIAFLTYFAYPASDCFVCPVSQSVTTEFVSLCYDEQSARTLSGCTDDDDVVGLKRLFTTSVNTKHTQNKDKKEKKMTQK